MKRATTEETTPIVGTEPSGEYGLYKATGRDRFPCCFCSEPIIASQPYFMLVSETRRRSHHICAMKALRKVIEVRDKKGRSEDK